MKKIALVILAAILAVSLTGCAGNDGDQTEESSRDRTISTEESDIVSVPEPSQRSTVSQTSKKPVSAKPDKSVVYEAYGIIIRDIISEHGSPEIINDRSFLRGYIKGVSVVRLFDMNKDGIDEMLCAYDSKGKDVADTQEIYSFIDGQAVSVYSGNVNYEDEDNPFIEYCTTSDGTYVMSGGKDMMYFDGKNIVVVSDVRSGGDNSQHLSLYNSDDPEKIVSDTNNTLKALGFTPNKPASVKNIRTTQEYKDAAAIYQKYIDSRAWAAYEYNGKKIKNKTLIVRNQAIFDYNGDGIFEMFFDTEHQYPDYENETTENSNEEYYYSHHPSYLLTIEDGKVKPLIKANLVDDIGGKSISFKYSETDNTVYITETDSLFEANEKGTQNDLTNTLYMMEGTNLSEKIKTFSTVTKYTYSDDKTAVSYKIDDEDVKKADYEKQFNLLYTIDADKLDMYFNEKSKLSNKERLAELGVLYIEPTNTEPVNNDTSDEETENNDTTEDEPVNNE